MCIRDSNQVIVVLPIEFPLLSHSIVVRTPGHIACAHTAQSVFLLLWKKSSILLTAAIFKLLNVVDMDFGQIYMNERYYVNVLSVY